MYKPEANRLIAKFVVRFLEDGGDPLLFLGSLSKEEAYKELGDLLEALETLEEGSGAAIPVRAAWFKLGAHQSLMRQAEDAAGASVPPHDSVER